MTSSSDITTTFLKNLSSPDPVVRGVTARCARRRGAPALAGLADLAAGEDKPIAKAAKKAMEDITHYAARPGARDEAATVAAELLHIAEAKPRPRMVRAHALYLLGFAGDDRAIPGLTRLLPDPEIGEDARMALERIGSKGITL